MFVLNHSKMNFQKKVSPVLTEIHDTFWENDLKAQPNDWSDEDMASATKIFTKIIFETMWNRKMETKDATKMGEAVHKLVLDNTGVDLKKYYI